MSRMKMMMTILVGVAAVLIATYVWFPEYRSALASAAPLLLVLVLCPLAMYFMMGGKHDKRKNDGRNASAVDDKTKGA